MFVVCVFVDVCGVVCMCVRCGVCAVWIVVCVCGVVCLSTSHRSYVATQGTTQQAYRNNLVYLQPFIFKPKFAIRLNGIHTMLCGFFSHISLLKHLACLLTSWVDLTIIN